MSRGSRLVAHDSLLAARDSWLAAGHSRRRPAKAGRYWITVLAFAIGCGSPRGTGPESRAASPESRAGRPESRAASVSLPDISGAAPAVQSQLREAYTAMLQKVAAASSAGERAAAYGDMGRLFLATEFFDSAETCFLNAQTLEPADPRWPYFLAHIHRRKNDPEKAAALFERVLALDPNHVAALIWLGDMRIVEGHPDAAEAPLAKALTLAPHEAAALDRAGRAAPARRDYATAIKDLGAALEIQPQASSLHYPLSVAYRALNDTRNADAHLKLRGDVAAALNDPLMQQVGALLQNASAAEVRGVNAMAARQWADAVVALRQAIAQSPGNAFTHLNLGTALFETGNAKGALDEFQAAIRLSPDLSKAHYGAGIVLEAGGREKEAMAAFTKAVDADPASIEARMSLADVLRRNGRERESLPHYADVIARSPAVSQATFGYAMALVRLGRYREARDRLDVATKTYADQPGFSHALARLLAAAPDDTVRDGARALAIMQGLLQNQRTLELMQTMAMALAEVGRFEEAAQWQQETMAAAAQSNRRDLDGRLAENLNRYVRRLACRMPWPDNDPVFRPRPSP
jgi:tetratricopeptide (TPR) repeat protein